MADFRYYTVEDVDNTRFYQMPKILFEDERFIDLSDSAKILYSILRDRTDLSKKNNWIDEQGRIYIIFTIKEIMEKMRWGNKKAGKILQAERPPLNLSGQAFQEPKRKTTKPFENMANMCLMYLSGEL